MGILRFASTAIKDATTAGRSWLTGTVSPSDVLLAADLDTPNNPPSLDSEGNLIGTFVQRTGTDSEINAITLQAGELAYTTDTLEVRIGDGTTPGGVFLYAKPRRVSANVSNHSSESATLNDITGTEVTYKANCRYRVLFRIIGSDAGSASNWKFQISGTANWVTGEATADFKWPSHTMTWFADYNDLTTYETKTIVRDGTVFSWIPGLQILPSVASKALVRLHGEADIRTGASAGSFKLQAAQNSSSTSALSVGAVLMVQRVL